MDLKLVCFDLASTCFEGSPRPSERFASPAFGYSRERRGDRPRIVIGLLCTSEGIPIARHVFAGDTNDASTLPAVLDDLAARFAVGRVAVCVHAAVIETLIGHDLAKADVRDPDLDHQHLSAARALRELNRIRGVELTANGRNIDLTTRRTPLQARALTAIGTDTRSWDKATIT